MTTRCHTFTGTGFDPFNPRPEDVRLEDIAHHLAMTCRYGGASPVYYSVAEHAIRVSDLVLDLSGDPRWALRALHHDSAEAFVHDIRRPIKRHVLVADKRNDFEPVAFDVFEFRVHEAIVIALSRQLESVDDLDSYNRMERDADSAMLLAEMESFGMPDPPSLRTPIKAARIGATYNWRTAERMFLATHERLCRQIGTADR